MEFFNKKEEVIEIILTEKGKQLFSQGKFVPTYYSFHDTDITYDNGVGEEQNNIVPRIRDTPTLKNNTCIYFGLADNKLKHNLYCELGSKTIGDQYKPAWDLNFIKSPPFQYVGNRNQPTDTKKFQVRISSSYDNNNAYQEYIPQFDIQTIYQLGCIEKKNGSITEKEFYLVKDDPVLLDMTEYNSFEENENEEYELEVFYVNKSDDYTKLTFDINLQNNVFNYLKLSFDDLSMLKQGNKYKNNYGNLVEKDESNC
jgi:hypothetical protein